MPWAFPVGSMVGDNRSLTIRVHFPKSDVTKTMVFDAQMTVGQACEHIRGQSRESDQMGEAKDYGLFLPHEDNKKGLWLDNARTLEHYILRNGDTVEFRYRYRWLYIRTMDGTQKKLCVDDSKSVAELMLMICTKMGIYNHDEYSLVRERDEHERDKSLTLRRSGPGIGTLGRDQEKMEKLKRKLRTDDDINWLNPSQSLRQQGIDENEILLLKRRYFFSDMNVDARDPVQLNLLYVQLKDAILKGTHPVSLEEAIHLAALQCQVQFGDYVPDKFKPNFLDLKDFLPKEYIKLRNVEKKIFQQYAEMTDLSEVEAKVKYCQFCRSLKTYGITFFLVKERIKGKNKLIPRLLGVTKDSVIRLDEKTKEVLKIWPLTSISRWAASLHAFTMDFGEYSPDDCYTAQTSEGEQISQLIAGYVDIITKKQKAKDHAGFQGDEESAMYEENVRAERATIIQHQRLPPIRGRAKEGLVNGAIDGSIARDTDDSIQMSAVHRINGWSQQHIIGDDMSTVVDGQSVLTSGVPPPRQMSPDNFMIGGTHIFHYQEMTPAQRALLVTINEDVEALQAAKEQLHIGPVGERVLLGVGSDETSCRWLSESLGASQAKVTDEMGAMNAAVAQALRSANRAETYDAAPAAQTGLGISSDPGDDLMMMQQSFRVVTIHFPAFVDDVKRVAVLRREAGAIRADQTGEPYVAEKTEESTQNLLSAARHVADAFTDLLESARPLATGRAREEIIDGTDDTATGSHAVITTTTVTSTGPVSSSSRKAIIEAASRVGEASNDLLRHVMNEDVDETMESTHLQLLTEEERLYQDQLLGLAKAVANATAGLVVKAKNLATQPSLDPEAQQRVIAAATQTGLCTSQLVACTKVLAPTIHQPTCQQQLSEAAREVTWAVDGIVQASRATGLNMTDQPPNVQQSVQAAITDTETAATEVRDALDQLNAHLLKASAKAYSGDALDNFQMAYENLQQHHTGDGQRMVAAARRLAQATAQMIADIKAQAELSGDDPERQSRLFAAAKQLADATTTLISAAKVCSANPDDVMCRNELREAAENLNVIAYSAAAELLHNRLIRSLQAAARATVTGATQLVNVSQVATKRSRGNTYQVLSDAKAVDGMIPRTVISIRESRANPDDPMTQMALIGACERFVQPCEALVRSSRSVAPTVSDPTVQAALDNSTGQLASAVETLRACLGRLAPLSRHLQMDGALARLARLCTEAATIETSLKQGTLVPLPDEKIEDCFHLLSMSVQDGSASTRELQSIIEGLAQQDPEVANRPDICGIPATILASSMAGLVQATRGVVAHEGLDSLDSELSPSMGPAVESARRAVTQDTRQAVQLAYELVKAASDARIASDVHQTGNLATVLSHSEQLTGQLLDALNRCLRGLPGHREISEATHLIERRRNNLVELAQSAPTRKVRLVEPSEYERTQSDLTRAAVEFNQATGDLLSSYSPGAFRRTTRRFTGAYDQLTDKGVELSLTSLPISPPGQPQVNQDLVHGLVNVSDHSHALMTQASRVCARPEEQDLRTRFQAAARDVTESISQLLTICTTGVTPDQRDCEIALRRLEALRPLLENPNRPVNQETYYDCVDSVAKSLSPLADSLRNMSNSAKEQQTQEFGAAVQQCAASMCQLVEETAQAAYLIGLADPRSEPGKPSLVNSQLFLRTQKEIQEICDAICSPSVTNRQVISLSTEMARSAKVLCEACSSVSAQTPNPQARQQLNNLTRETMQSITALIQHRSSMATNEQVADGDWAEANRQTTLASAQAVSSNVARLVHLLTTGPQFAGHAPRVTDEAKESQIPVCSAGLASLNAAQSVLRAAQNLIISARSGQSDMAFSGFSTASKDLSESIKTLAAAMRDHAPGQRECQRVLNNIVRLMQELQQAKMASMEDHLQPRRELNEEGFQKQLATSARALMDAAPTLGRAARSEAEQLGHAALLVDSYLPGLTSGAIAAASRSPLSSTQLIYLEHASAVLEATDQLVTVARDAGGNPRAAHFHNSLDDAVRGVMDSCEDLLGVLDDIASRQGHVSTLIDTLNRALAQTEEIIQVPVDARFADYQARLLRIARHMEQLNQAIQLRARQPSSEGELTPLAHTLTQEYQEMCQTCKGATATLPDARQADELRAAVKAVGLASAGLVHATTGSRLRGSDIHGGQQMLLSRNRGIADLDKRAELLDCKLRELIALLELQGPNTQACLQSASTVSGIIADLDTTILFASSGTLHAPIHDDVDALLSGDDYQSHYELTGSGDTTDRRGLSTQSTENFGPIRESIARTARALVDDTQNLVSGTGEDQTRLASTAHTAVERVTQLADVVKRGAAVIGPGQPDTQIELLSACRDVATGLRNVFQSASRLSGRTGEDPVQDEVRTNAQLTVSSISSLLQKVKTIEDDERRGLQALTLAAKYCRDQAAQLTPGTVPNIPAGSTTGTEPTSILTPVSSRKSAPSVANMSAVSNSSSLIARYLAPDDLARAASGPVQSAVSKVILASNTQSQSDILTTAAATRDVVTDLITATKALLRCSEASPDTRNACAVTSKELAEQFAGLLDALKATLQPDCRAADRECIPNSIRRIADLSHTLLTLLDGLREGPRLVMYFRASSPEWRDVAEKFIGRHVAYHHHYVPNYSVAGPGSTHRSTYIRPTCYPLRSPHDTKDGICTDENESEAQSRIQLSIQQLDQALSSVDEQSKGSASLLRIARSVASATQNLITTARTIGLVPQSEAADRARHAPHRSASLWRTELTVALATQHMCQLSQLCSEALRTEQTLRASDGIDTDNLFGTSMRLVPSRERLLAAVRKVAAASAQLLMWAKARKLAYATSDIHKLQTAGQAVKEATDKLSFTVQQGDLNINAEELYRSAQMTSSLQGVIETQAQIRSQRSELDALERQLAHLDLEQRRAHPALFDEPNS